MSKKVTCQLKPLIIHNPFLDPIIPKRTTWSYSTLKLFRKCKRKFYWTKLLRLSSRREAAPLVISNTAHEGLARWYCAKRTSMKKIITNIVKETQKRIEQNFEFYGQDEYDDLQILLNTLTGMLTAYAKVYAKDREKWSFAKKDTEVWFQVSMGPFDFKGKIDLLPLQKGKQLIVDHKVVSKIGESFVEKLALDSQMRGYILGSTEHLKRPPSKVVYNLIRKCKLRQKSNESVEEFSQRIQEDYLDRPDFYFQRETLRFSKQDVEAFKYDLQKTHAEYAWLINYAFDAEDPREWPCSDGVCDDFFRTCDYFPLCTQGLDKGTARLYQQYNKK